MGSKIKVIFMVLLAGLLIATVSGCASPTAPAPTAQPAPKPAPEKVFIRVDGGPAGSSKYLTQELLSQAFRKGNPDWNVQVVAGPTTVALYGMMLQGNMDVMYFMSTLLPGAREGKMFDEKMPSPLEMRWIVPVNIQYMHMFTSDDAPVTGFADWISKKVPLSVAIGRIGGEPWFNSKTTIEAYGTTIPEMEKWGCKFYYGSSTEAGTRMSDGIAKVYLQSNNLPQPDMVQVAITKKLKLFGVPEPEIRAKLIKLGYGDGIIPAKTYTFQAQDVRTVTAPFLEVVPAKMTDNVAYNLTRAIIENRDFLYSTQPSYKEVLVDEYLQKTYKDLGEWIHPGAKKYLLEKGIIK